ncbi:alpha-mannosidase [Synechococcus sp. CB0101]|uniref:alpha-mannosidase n=1 Tax=Synechococcus sp. CB0101 TaxID=232348 RepID=UPI000200112D|nr:alpha-mannosidase [Synechococcus sp. CB0101]QCH15184.1 alpha-mannosidase [Synechococcus sp. CB0101]
MPEGPERAVRSWIETFQGQSRLDLRPLWRRCTPAGAGDLALLDPWGARHRPDWHARGLLIWPRGGRWLELQLELVCPVAWQQRQQGDRLARLVLRWWADAVDLRVNGERVHQGDLFDTACRWPLPAAWWNGEPLQLQLRLRSPLHDDGALITSAVEQEPLDSADPSGVLAGPRLALAAQRLPAEAQPALLKQLDALDPADPTSAAVLEPWLRQQEQLQPPGPVQVLGHAHLDLAWLWPVADTWQAAVRTFESALSLMECFPELHFAHSTPALYAWIEQHRPALFARLRAAMQAGRFEPINGPWVESDCVLIGTASLQQQFALGQAYSRSRFPELTHNLCWLPDSFGFSAGLPAVARSTGVEWFCTHKLAWNSGQPFPHRLFRWRSRCGSELLALATAPIGTDGDPLAIEAYSRAWQGATGVDQALWLPGVGDHGGGPTAEMLEQLQLWQNQPLACPQTHGSLRQYLAGLEPLAAQLPVWRDELYLELHRGCATSRPDQKRHNRSLERLLREADLAQALQHVLAPGAPPPAPADWKPLLFQQFHDILPGTSIPEVFEQAEPQWRAARRQARRCRDAAWQALLPPHRNGWWLVQGQLQSAGPCTLRLPAGSWRQLPSQAALPQQSAPGGGTWVQINLPAGVAAVPLQRAALEAHSEVVALQHPVVLQAVDQTLQLSNGLVRAAFGPTGLEQLWGADGVAQLAEPAAWCRWRDHGEFWDAWDLAVDYRQHPLPLQWQSGPDVAEQGPLCTRLVWRGRCGSSRLRLDVQLRAASPWLELTLQVDWCQRHELLRLELPLAQAACRYAADTSGGVIERPAAPVNGREQARWEVPAISWLASQRAAGGGLAVLLDGPQGVSADTDRLGVSLLRAPTWPDPSADQGRQRLRLALMPCAQGWRQQAVPLAAQRFREPLWIRPAAGAGAPEGWPALDLGSTALQLVQLQPHAQPGTARLTVQNLSPQRQQLRWPQGWIARRESGEASVDLQAGDQLLPWQLGHWQIWCAGGDPQSS